MTSRLQKCWLISINLTTSIYAFKYIFLTRGPYALKAIGAQKNIKGPRVSFFPSPQQVQELKKPVRATSEIYYNSHSLHLYTTHYINKYKYGYFEYSYNLTHTHTVGKAWRF